MKSLTNYIQLDQCEHQYLYLIDARNAIIGIYNKYTKGFIILRTKWKCKYLFTEYHWDIGGDKKDFGTVKPLEKLKDSGLKIEEDFNEHDMKDKELYDKIFNYLKKRDTKTMDTRFKKILFDNEKNTI